MSDSGGKQAIAMSWIAFALFVSLATGVSAMLSVQSQKIYTGAATAEVYSEKATQGWETLVEGISGMLNVRSVAPAKAPAQIIEKLPEGALGAPAYAPQISKAEEARDVGGIAPTPSVLPLKEAPSIATKRIWFLPKGAEACNIFSDSLVQSFTPTYNCFVDEYGVPKRIFCPVFISHEQVSSRGTVQFRATGSCEGVVTATVTDKGFENIQ